MRFNYPRARDACLLCVGAAIGHRLITRSLGPTLALAFSPYYTIEDWLSEMSAGAYTAIGRGVLLGIIWSILVVPFILRKPLLQMATWVLVIYYAIVVIGLLTWWTWEDAVTAPVLRRAVAILPTALFVFISFMVKWRLPDVEFGLRQCQRCGYDIRPRCVRCGYDLTGNVSGICPECGNAIAKEGDELADKESGVCPEYAAPIVTQPVESDPAEPTE